jgi:UDP:flavonoid glycosyltransferase YjiC (YdhE family)
LKNAEDAQRRDLGLPKATVRAVRRIVEGGTLEIQAYDELFFPGLADEWGGTRPFVGAMTLAQESAQDDDVVSWIAAGDAPVYFGFGSMPVSRPAEAVDMITTVCADLGVRALICTGAWDLGDVVPAEHVKIVRSVNHADVFPLCRAVVHHGGAGTTAAGIRAGVPSLVLWVGADQPFWAKQVERLKVGAYARFSKTTTASLREALRSVLQPSYVTRAREVATWLTKPAASVSATADLLEEAARGGRRST